MAGNYEFITKSLMIYCNKFMSKIRPLVQPGPGATKKAVLKCSGFLNCREQRIMY